MDFRRLPERGGRPDRRSRDHHAGLCRTTLRNSDYSGWGQSETIDAAYVPGPTEPPIPAPDRTFGQGTWLRWQLALTDKFSLARERRTYFHIPASGYGTRNVDYARTLLGYDDAGRQNQTTDPDDTIDKTTFNAVGWPVAQAVATLTTTGPSALTTVRSDEFDDSGNLTRTTLPVDGNTGARPRHRFRLRLAQPPGTPNHHGREGRRPPDLQQFVIIIRCGLWTLISVSTYDNLNQVVAVSDYHTSYNSASPETNRTGYRTSAHDPLGRIWQTAVYAVNSGGVASNPQISGTWYTATGRVARSAPSGSKLFTATVFDAVGRAVKSFAAYSLSAVPSNPADVSNAVVMEQREMEWDQAGNLTATITRQRLDTVPDTTLGELTVSTSRTTYAASYPDAVGRTFATADYGTNGSTNGSGGWTRLSHRSAAFRRCAGQLDASSTRRAIPSRKRPPTRSPPPAPSTRPTGAPCWWRTRREAAARPARPASNTPPPERWRSS